MRILSTKTQWRVIALLVGLASRVKPSSYNGTMDEQFERFNQFTTEITDLVYRLAGVEGLAYLNERCGIPSNPEFNKEQK